MFAVLAVVLFGLSPLAMEFSRSVYLDNVAVPWLLAAFVLASSPRRQPGRGGRDAACFVVAVLSKETTLVLLPALVLDDLAARRPAHPATHPLGRRRRCSSPASCSTRCTPCSGAS